jgi:hypothetical protein
MKAVDLQITERNGLERSLLLICAEFLFVGVEPYKIHH